MSRHSPRLPVLVCETVRPAVRQSTLDANKAKDIMDRWVEAHRRTEELREDLQQAVEFENALKKEALTLLVGHVTDPLTRRERDVFACIHRNLTNKEIGSQLCLSERTVKFHVSSILHKTGTHNRTELAAMEYELLCLASKEETNGNPA